MTFKERLVVDLKRFLTFLFNKNTGEILGRTCFSWSKLLVFYLAFYLFFTGIFAIHLSAFLAITPGPDGDTTPWNYGKYAYHNYPNSKIALVSVPKFITYKEGQLILDDATQEHIDTLLPSANASGVSSACLDGSTTHGYTTNQPCIFLHVARVFQWTPDLINDSLSSQLSLPITCSFESSDTNLVINVTSNQAGIPLNLNNSGADTDQSFPYSGQDNYNIPVMAVTMDLTSLPAGLPNTFSATISCGIDFNSLGMIEPSESKLKRLYEVPESATIRVNFRL